MKRKVVNDTPKPTPKSRRGAKNKTKEKAEVDETERVVDQTPAKRSKTRAESPASTNVTPSSSVRRSTRPRVKPKRYDEESENDNSATLGPTSATKARSRKTTDSRQASATPKRRKTNSASSRVGSVTSEKPDDASFASSGARRSSRLQQKNTEADGTEDADDNSIQGSLASTNVDDLSRRRRSTRLRSQSPNVD